MLIRKSFIRSRFQVLRNFSNNSTVASRKARMASKAPSLDSKNSNARIVTPLRIGVIFLLSGFGYIIYDINENKNGALGQLYYGSFLDHIVRKVYDETYGRVLKVYEPASEKLLPTWPTDPCYEGIPPGTPAPPLLVLDLERTLIGSTHDAVHGWRHVKRPGLDKFLERMVNYYEVVIHSENDKGVVMEILEAIDPEQKTHKLGSAQAEVRGDKIIKRLDLMNRDLRRIVAIDDNPTTAEYFPRNTLLIKPYTDVNDVNDTALLDLIPLLQALHHDGVEDFRDCFDDLGTHDAAEAALEYQMRLDNKKHIEMSKRNRGIGKWVRGDLIKKIDSSEESRSSILKSSEIAGQTASLFPSTPAAPGADQVTTALGKGNNTVTKKKGALLQWFDEKEEEKLHKERIKMEKMNELYIKKMADKNKEASQS